MVSLARAKAIAAGAGFDLFAIGTKGATLDKVMVPHRQTKGPHAGSYVASKTNNEADYKPVATTEELKPLLRRGFGVRMAPVDEGSPSNLFVPTSVHGWR